MPKYDAKQVSLLIRLAAAHAKVPLSLDGMKDLAIALEEDARFKDLKIEWKERYLRDRLSCSEKEIDPDFSEERINVLAQYAGFQHYDDYRSSYLAYCNIINKENFPQTPVFLANERLSAYYQTELSPVCNLLDHTVPDFRSFAAETNEENLSRSKIINESNGGVFITTATELESLSLLAEDLRQKWLVFIHDEAKGAPSVKWPAERVIRSATNLQMVTVLLCSPELLFLSEETEAKTDRGNTISGTVNGTVFQGGVNIHQNNHSTGQQFVTSSDVHITNNNHYNQNT